MRRVGLPHPRVRTQQGQRVLQLLLLEEAQRVNGVHLCCVHLALDQQGVGGAARDAVEVTRHQHGDVSTCCYLLQPLEEGVDLPELHVIQLRVCMDVRVGHTNQGAPVGCVRGAWLNCLQHRDQRHVVLQQAVQCRFLLGLVGEGLCQGEGSLVEFHLILLYQREPVTPEERGTAINCVLVVSVDLSGLLLVNSNIASLLQLWSPELKVVITLNLLQAENVCLVRQELAQEVLLAVMPVEGPCWAAVRKVGLGIQVSQQVVRQQREAPIGVR
mmetsp:Transcript_13551/g.28992  ORF Transcript_13551/g.28992 Transcript_13551/m.28992 type:complete len:272 (-) Transcript_13551:804-1619(-)